MLDVARAMANVFPNTEIPDIDTKQIHRNLTRREHVSLPSRLWTEGLETTGGSRRTKF